MSKIRLVEAKVWKAEIGKASAPIADLGLTKTCALDVDRVLEATAKAAGAEKADRVLRFTISTEDVDRDFDTISVAGWDLKNYKKNPVVLWAHDYWSPPIARSLSVTKEDGALVSMAEFADAEMSMFGDMIFRMLTGKFLRATSVGFIPHEWVVTEDVDRPYGYDFKKQELLEYSVCPVPSNPACIIDAHKAGVNTAPLKAWAEKVLDLREPLVGITRTEIEQAWDAVSTRAIIIDLKGAEDPPVVPAVVPEPTPDPVVAAVAPTLGACPECAAVVTLALPVDGAEVHHRCECGAAWKIASIDLIDVSDYSDELIELAADEEPAFDFDEAALSAAVENIGASLRAKLDL